MARVAVEFAAAFLGRGASKPKTAQPKSVVGGPQEVDCETNQGRRPDQIAYSQKAAVGSLIVLLVVLVVGALGSAFGIW